MGKKREPVSTVTPIKEAQVDYIYGLVLQIVAEMMRRHRAYTYPWFLNFDLHAGPGRWDDGTPDGILGSPLLFLQNACRFQMPFKSFFFEKDASLCVQLREEIRKLEIREGGFQRGFCEVVEGDHYEMVPEIVRQIPIRADAYGLVYADPTNHIVPVQAMRSITERDHFQRLDFLLNAPATTYKRVQGLARKKEEFDVDVRTLEADLRGLGKKYVQVREPIGTHQWSMIVATDWEQFPALRRKRDPNWVPFYPVESADGQRILHRLCLTEPEYKQWARVNGVVEPSQSQSRIPRAPSYEQQSLF